MKKLSIVFALLLLLLSGCGIMSLGYNNSDVYLSYTINSYATFSSKQKDTIKKNVAEYMQWHRKNMLPAYVSYLRELQSTVQSEATLAKEDVTRFRKELRALYVETLQPAVKPAAKFLSSVEDGQIGEMASTFAKENKKQKEKELAANLDDYLSKREERTVDFLEHLVGEFSDAQRQQIHDLSYKLPLATTIYIQLKEDNQTHLLEMLATEKKEDSIANYLSLWLLMPEKFRYPGEQQLLKEFELASDAMIAEVYAMLNARQKNTLSKNLEKYIETFQALSEN